MGRNFIQLAFASAVGSVLGLATSAYLGRILGVSGFGVFSLGRTMMDYVLLPLSLGITVIGSREIAGAESERKAMIAGDVAVSRALMACVSAVALFAVTLLVGDPQLRRVLLVLSVMLPLQLVNLDWLYSAHESQALPSFARTIGRVVCFVGTFLVVRGPGQVWLAAGMLVVEFAITVAILGPGAWKLVDTRPARRSRLRGPFMHIVRSLPAGLGSLGSRVKTNADVMMLGAMSSSLAVGYYSAAYRLVFFVQTFTGLFATVLLPRVSRAYGDRSGDAKRVVATSLRGALTVAAALLGTVAPLSGELMVLVFGPKYEPARSVMLPLVVAAAFLIMSMTLGNTAIGLKRDRFYAMAAWIAAGGNVAVNLYVIPRWSYFGATITTLGTELALAASLAATLWTDGVADAVGPRRLAALGVHAAACAIVGRFVLGMTGLVVLALAASIAAWLVSAMPLGIVSRDDARVVREALR